MKILFSLEEFIGNVVMNSVEGGDGDDDRYSIITKGVVINEVLDSTNACGSLTDYEGFADGSVSISNSKDIKVNEVINSEDLVDACGSNSEGFANASGNGIVPSSFAKNEDILHPVLGMEFDSANNAYLWYKDYAIKS
jgi:hypothetical protein